MDIGKLKSKLFRLGDTPTGYTFKDNKNLRGRATGEFRNPNKNEFYLSENMAYRAPNNLSYNYYIAEIVEIETITIIKVIT